MNTNTKTKTKRPAKKTAGRAPKERSTVGASIIRGLEEASRGRAAKTKTCASRWSTSPKSMCARSARRWASARRVRNEFGFPTGHLRNGNRAGAADAPTRSCWGDRQHPEGGSRTSCRPKGKSVRDDDGELTYATGIGSKGIGRLSQPRAPHNRSRGTMML